MNKILYITILAGLVLCSPALSQNWEWKRLPDMPTERFGHCSVVYQDKVWLIGGMNRLGDTLTSVEYFNLENHKWESDVSNLLHSRLNAAAVVYHDTVFVIGGIEGQHILSSVEYYDTNAKKWEEFVPLSTPRYGLDAVVYDDKMYIIGGQSRKGSLFPPVDVVEFWDKDTKKWQVDSTWKLEKPRVFMKSIVVGNYVYTVGGLLIDLRLDLVERFAIGSGVEMRTSLPSPRFSFSMVALRDTIYVIGGYQTLTLNELHDTIEIYDTHQDRWDSLSIYLSTPRAALTAVQNNDSIYVFGGIDAERNVSRSAELFARRKPMTVVSQDHNDNLPREHRLINNYPNPFNAVTTIHFQVGKQDGQLRLVIFNLMGQPIRAFDLSSLPPGSHHIQWDGSDKQGRAVESGIYLAQLRSKNAKGRILKLSLIK